MVSIVNPISSAPRVLIIPETLSIVMPRHYEDTLWRQLCFRPSERVEVDLTIFIELAIFIAQRRRKFDLHLKF